MRLAAAAAAAAVACGVCRVAFRQNKHSPTITADVPGSVSLLNHVMSIALMFCATCVAEDSDKVTVNRGLSLDSGEQRCQLSTMFAQRIIQSYEANNASTSCRSDIGSLAVTCHIGCDCHCDSLS
jgi:hypothetical protein